MNLSDNLKSKNKKLIFGSNLDSEINSEYINHWNDNFICDPKFDDKEQIYKKPMKKVIYADLRGMREQICNKKHGENKNNYGVISKDFMSYLMYERFYLVDCENVLWEILNASKNFTNANSKNIAEVDLSGQLNETQNSRIEKLMKTNFGDRLIEDNNYDASDVEDCYFEYAKSKYVDRYFFYFSRLRDLSRYGFDNTNEEYEKYNVENIKKVKSEIEINKASISKFQNQANEADLELNVISSKISMLKDKNDEESINQSKKLNDDLMVKNRLFTDTNQTINKLKTKNLELQKILDDPLTKFYEENQKETEIVKREIDDIKEGWKRQYQKFIFAYMLEHPDKILKLSKIIKEHWTNKTAIAFSEFLIKHANHSNFSYACLEFDNLLKNKNLYFDSSSKQSKSNLYKKYKSQIEGLDQNKRMFIDSLLRANDQEETLEYKFVGKASCIFYCCLRIALIIGVGPMLLWFPVGLIVAGVCGILALVFLCMGLLPVARALVWFGNFCFNADQSYSYPVWMLTKLYPSTIFLTILYISLTILAIAAIFLTYKKIQYYYFEKNLKRPSEEKNLVKQLVKNKNIDNLERNNRDGNNKIPNSEETTQRKQNGKIS